MAVVVWMTPYGPAVDPDSTVYIGAARSLLSGEGYVSAGEAVTHFPPLYPLILAALGLLQIDLVQAARFLSAFLFGINLVLIGVAVYLATDHDLLLTASAPLILLASAPLLTLHAFARSEPLFIALSLAAIILLAFYIARRDIKFLIALSLALGLSFVARYIGVALLPPIMMLLLLGGSPPERSHRVRDSLILVAIACAPLALFMIRNTWIGGAPTDRHLVVHLVSPAKARLVVSNLYTLFVPFERPYWLKIAISMLASATLTSALVLIFKRRVKSGYWDSMAGATTLCCLLMSASYIFFLLVSISLFDAQTPVDTRLLSPVFVWLIVGLFGAVKTLSAALDAPILAWCFVLFILLSAGLRGHRTVARASQMHSGGEGYTSRAWQASQTMEFIKRLPDDATIYSNGPDAITFLSLRKSLLIPRKIFPWTLEANKSYHEETEAICNDVRANGAFLVYFNTITWRSYLPRRAELDTMCHLPILRRFGDATVYGSP